MAKHTDEQIKEALPNIAYGGHSCAKCKFDNGKGEDRCGLKNCKIGRLALDLINRQEAEIERLKNDCFCIANERDAIADCLNTAVPEAIKEFAERFAKAIEERLSEGIKAENPDLYLIHKILNDLVQGKGE